MHKIEVGQKYVKMSSGVRYVITQIIEICDRIRVVLKTTSAYENHTLHTYADVIPDEFVYYIDTSTIQKENIYKQLDRLLPSIT